jgi:hypothetical protein
MAKKLLLLLSFFPLVCLSQQPNVTGPISSLPGTVSFLPMYYSTQQGIPIIAPSNLRDTGSSLLYNNVPVGGSPTIVTLSGTTPNINAVGGDFTITMSGNTTPTISGVVQGVKIVGQICQPGSGGPYSWSWPLIIHGGGIVGTTAGTCSIYEFESFNGFSLVATSTGVTGVAP